MVVANEEPGANCGEGGSSVEVAGEPATKKYVCNGEAGTPGPEGEPWTAGGTLPSKATETGVWRYNGGVTAGLPLSFDIPLAAPITEASHTIINDPTNEHCENEEHAGTAGAANPEADPGYLCVYAGALAGATLVQVQDPATFGLGASVSGAILLVSEAEGGFHVGSGTWAVTG